MIKRPTRMAIAPVEFSPDREELRSLIVILGKDAKSIAFRDVESDRRTIEWQNALQRCANCKQQLTLTQFSNDRVVDLKENPEALLRRPSRTRFAGNGGRSPGLLRFSVFRCHHINANYLENGILHACVSTNPEAATEFEALSSVWAFTRRIENTAAKLGAADDPKIFFFKSAFHETFQPFGYHTVDALAGSKIQHCFHTASEGAVTRRSFKV